LQLPRVVRVDVIKVNAIAKIGLEPIHDGLIILSYMSPVGVTIEEL
jgi:hypothetical protein